MLVFLPASFHLGQQLCVHSLHGEGELRESDGGREWTANQRRVHEDHPGQARVPGQQGQDAAAEAEEVRQCRRLPQGWSGNGFVNFIFNALIIKRQFARLLQRLVFSRKKLSVVHATYPFHWS